MFFTTIGTNVDQLLARLAAFLRGAYEFRRDFTWADPARSDGSSYTVLDEAYDHGRDVAHRIFLRRYDDEQARAPVVPIRIPHTAPAFRDPSTHPLELSDIYPLALCCEGRVRYPEDNPIYGTYWLGSALRLGEYHRIEDAIAAASLILSNDSFAIDDGEALGFSPDLFVIRDQVRRLVLVGHVWGLGIRWCEPVSSDDEVVRVRAEVDQTCREASFEAGWDNHETARQLRLRATVLKGHLVHVAWRQRARNALVASGAWRSPCPSPSDPLPVPSYATYPA